METNTNDSDSSLYDRIRKRTEHKEPGSTFNSGSSSQSSGQKVSDYWKKADDFYKQTKEEPKADEQTEQPRQETTAVVNPEYAKLTEDQKKASAEIAVEGIDNLEHLIFRFIINYKFKKKFTDEEINMLDTVVTAEPALMKTEERNLWNKWSKLMAQRDKKIASLPMKEGEKNNMISMLKSYQDYKQKVLSPAWGIGIAIGNSIIQKGIDTFMDD